MKFHDTIQGANPYYKRIPSYNRQNNDSITQRRNSSVYQSSQRSPKYVCNYYFLIFILILYQIKIILPIEKEKYINLLEE